MQSNPFEQMVKTDEELRSIFAEPGELVIRKVISGVHKHCREFISRSPFLVISTSDDSGFCTISPRGDSPGCVMVLDERLQDSYTNRLY
ncbi:hypothetical protein [Jeotgalibacillus soli]|uniref:Pyridoxamine 5'-phosphate oxidase-like FMN-binding protein n=1 Tax=Jeotgalibacillus soli TaxID=889306 RepID=A0A0C2W7B6_9BACL|nr:hypothetical protein [Jeotgalibacillus soli]KIL51933.1 pyridoxamine 5'-phosphate oxidase-like FMN-binding protein [Jeotgalibacillus soli]